MPYVLPLATAIAPVAIKSIYEDFRNLMGFASPPNFITTQGHSLVVAQGTWEVVRNILVSGEIPRLTKELIFVAISKDRGCLYCAAAHIACCRMLGIGQETLAQLLEDVRILPDSRLRATVLFALKCARDPQSLSAKDFEVLRGYGLKQSEIVEIIGMCAFAVYANIIADATAMEPDTMFQSFT
jgi:uncharacterized peroxidase-related enzyme